MANLRIYSSVLQAVPSVILALFAGSWSDLNGRKALIISAIIGSIISNLVFMLNAYYFYELKAEYLLFEVNILDTIFLHTILTHLIMRRHCKIVQEEA